MQSTLARLLTAAAVMLFCAPAMAQTCTGAYPGSCVFQDDGVPKEFPALGENGGTAGSLKLVGSGTGYVLIQVPTGTITSYNLNLPATVGPPGSFLTSAGGGTLAMTWTVQVPLNAGGTNANLTPSNGGIFYSTATAGAILSGTSTAQQMMQSGSSAPPAWSTATWPATTTINQILYSSSANAVGGLATGNNSILATSEIGVPSLATAIPAGVTATTTAYAGDATAKIATNAFVQAANLLAMSTVPMAVSAGTYSFATVATVNPTINHVAAGGAITSATVAAGGTGVAVGDLFLASGGNHDAILRVATISGSAAATLSVVYGGTGYTTANGVTTDAGSAIPYTYLLSGALAGDVTIIATSGTYLTASQQWYFANNTTNSHTVTVCVSNGSDACSSGRTAIIPQGSANSRIVGVQTDGELNVDIASIVNAADLKGSTLASGVTGSSLTSVGALASGSLAAGFTAVGPAQGGTGVANNAANTITFTGNYGLGLTLSGATALTLPTSGTLATTANVASALPLTGGTLTGTLSLTPPTGLTQGLVLTQTGTGGSSSTGAPFSLNTVTIADQMAQAGAGLNFIYNVGGTAWQNQKLAILINAAITHDAAGVGPGSNDNMVGLTLYASGNVPVTSAYNIVVFGENIISGLPAGATGYGGVVGNEYDIYVSNTATANVRIGIQVDAAPVGAGDGGKRGSITDIAFAVGAYPTAAPFQYGFGWYTNGFNNTSDIMGGPATAANNGVNFNNVTISTCAFSSSSGNYCVNSAGHVFTPAVNIGGSGGPTVGGTPLGVHVTTDANLLVMNGSGNIQIEAVNDANNAYEPIIFIGSSLTLGGLIYLTNVASGAGSSALCYSTAGSQMTYDTSGTICGISALRFKNVDGPITNEKALAGIASLSTVFGRYKPEYQDHGDKEHVWVIADDVEKMDSRCVEYDVDGKLLNYSDRCLEAYLVGSIKGLKADNDNLVQEVAALKAAAN